MTTTIQDPGEADVSATDEELAAPNTSTERADLTWRERAERSDGRRRRRHGAAVVVLAVASAAVGGLAGTRIHSPADEAAARRPPTASRITVPVEQRVLSSTLVLAGEVGFNEPIAIRLGGSVGVEEGEAQVVTRVPAVDQAVAEGDSPFEVSGRPVFFMQGALPMYRRLEVGSVGADVAQLEAALERLGHFAGPADEVFDAATAEAVASFYSDAGYAAEGPTRAQRDDLRVARRSVADAEGALAAARREMATLSSGVSPSQLLQARQAVAAAEAAVPIAESTAARAGELAAQQVRSATAARDAATAAHAAATSQRDAMRAPGAIDPATGAAPTASRIAELELAVSQAANELQAAETALLAATNDQQAVSAQGRTDIAAAVAQLELARVQLAELSAPVVLTDAQIAVEQAEANLEQANADLDDVAARAGLRVSPGEIVFLPTLPSTITELSASLGSPASEQLATMSTAETLVSAKVSRADASLVTVGAPVTIVVRDAAVETTGTVVSVGQPSADAEESGGGRLEVVVAPDDPAQLRDFVYLAARVTIDVASTNDEVLVVPVSALTVGADGVSRVEIETAPVTDTSEGATELIDVEVGLSAEGLVEVRSPELSAGDRVVVGTEIGADDSTGDDGDDA